MWSHFRGLAVMLSPLPILALVAWLSTAEPADATPTATPWSELVDPDALGFEDPFRGMDDETLAHLRSYVTASEGLRGDDVLPEARVELQSRLDEARLALAALDLDPVWLLSQRWVVAERRRAAAEDGNPDLDGQAVAMTGFFIPAMTAVDGSSIGYLVARPGLCSHLPPPPSNQLVRLVLPAGTARLDLYDQVEVHGTLALLRTTQSVFVLDGQTRMRSTWTMRVDALRPVPVTGGYLRPAFQSLIGTVPDRE